MQYPPISIIVHKFYFLNSRTHPNWPTVTASWSSAFSGHYSAYITQFDRIKGRGEITGISLVVPTAARARQVVQNPDVIHTAGFAFLRAHP